MSTNVSSLQKHRELGACREGAHTSCPLPASRERTDHYVHMVPIPSRDAREIEIAAKFFFFFSCECNNVSFPQVCGHWKEDARVASSAVRNPFDHQSWLFQARQVGQSREIMSGVVRPL